MKNVLYTILFALGMQSCANQQPSTEVIAPANTHDLLTTTDTSAAPVLKDTLVRTTPADAATILARKQVPVLCYHRLTDWKPNERSSMKEYIVPPASFREQMQSLADSGYHTITPDQYYAYLTTGAPLPSKPVMITFDDTSEEQFTVGAAELDKHGFKGVFFIMTISIGRPRYMSSEQIKTLADNGHVIGTHTWDHHNVKNYGPDDWDVQFKQPREKLEAITGKPVTHFAYPFGLWNEAAIPELKKRGYLSAYQLSANKRDSTEPLYSLRRMIVPGTWNTATMHKWIKFNFR